MARRELEKAHGDYVAFGDYERHVMPVDQYVMLPQVRAGLNPSFDIIKESIREVGILNRVDVARVSEEALVEYLELVNRIWGTSVAFDDYAHLQQPDGMFYLVIAGHTRTEALRQLMQEDRSSDNPSANPYDMAVDIHAVSTPMDIIKLQMHENSYSAPPPERRAQGLVEAYYLGLRTDENPNGLWRNMKEFSEVNGISASILSEALNFAKLPSEAIDFVYSGKLSFKAAVELGKGCEVIEAHERMKVRFGIEDGDQVDDKDADEAYKLKIAEIITLIFAKGLGVAASQKHIKGQVDLMKQQLSLASGDQTQSELPLFDVTTGARAYISTLREQLNELNAEIERMSPENIAKFMKLQERLTRSETELKEASRTLAEVGAAAVKQLVAA